MPDFYRSGTGILRFASGAGPHVELRIDLIDYNTGVASTIQRAELVRIFKDLQLQHASQDLIICIDRLASIYMKDKHMRCPSLRKENKHEELLSLDRILENLAQKASEGIRVKLLKAKSHIDTAGNEKADKLARAHVACRPWNCNDVAPEGVDMREHIFWPHFAGRKIHNLNSNPSSSQHR